MNLVGQTRRLAGISVFAILFVLGAGSAPGGSLSPIHFTSGSVLCIIWQTSATLTVEAVNCPAKEAFKRLMQVTGLEAKLPENIHGRFTGGAGGTPLQCLDHLAFINALYIKPDSRDSVPELAPRDPEWYNLTDEQRLAACAKPIDVVQPATGIMSGYFFYNGHYISPPYAVTKVKVRPFLWEIRVNGLPWRTSGCGPSRGWFPEPDAEGQLPNLGDIWRYCHRLWRESEEVQASVEETKEKIARFLDRQRIVKSHEWPGKYVLCIWGMDGQQYQKLIKEIQYPPREQLTHSEEFHGCLMSLLGEIANAGKVKNPEKAKEVVLDWLITQEAAAGPADLPEKTRRENARKYFDKELEGTFGLNVGIPKPPTQKLMDRAEVRRLAAQAEIEAERNAESTRQQTARNLHECGLLFYSLYTRVRGLLAHTHKRLQDTIALVKSGLPLDVKAASLDILWDDTVYRKTSWMILANFRDVDAVSARVNADMKLVKAGAIRVF